MLLLVMSQGVRVFPWKVLGPGDDNSESINTLKFIALNVQFFIAIQLSFKINPHAS